MVTFFSAGDISQGNSPVLAIHQIIMPARVGRRLKCLPAFSGHFCYTSKITGSHYLKYPRPWADHVQSRFGHTWLDHQRWLES